VNMKMQHEAKQSHSFVISLPSFRRICRAGECAQENLI
jgi:hypothetical protein